jgi:hypothetical protein
MGYGFPGRHPRAALGKSLEDDGTAEPGLDVAGREFNLAWWNASGASNTLHRAWAVIDPALLIGGATLPKVSGECWNPDIDDALRPAAAHVATGHYRLTYAAAYTDEDGYPEGSTVTDNSPLTLYGVAVGVQGTDPVFQACGQVAFDGTNWIVDVYVKNVSTNTASDKTVLIVVF